MKIREFRHNAADYQSIVNIQRALYPDWPTTAEDYRAADERRDRALLSRRWLAEVDGNVVGLGRYYQNWWTYHPRRLNMRLRVLPGYEDQGIGSALYRHVLEAARELNPSILTLTSWVREDNARGLRFVRDRGFEEVGREFESHLDVRKFDPAPHEGVLASVSVQDIQLLTVAELAHVPDRDQKLYELDWTVARRTPSSYEPVRPDFEQWRRASLTAPDMWPGAFIVAVHEDNFVGLNRLHPNRSDDVLFNLSTGVRKDFRKRGIGIALRVRGIMAAQEHGLRVIKVVNQANNEQMLALNKQLGFEPRPAIIEFVKPLGTG
jgi:GNAT superfamily N-acetyltransferase